ncbi:MAG: response regulator transcription factor [Chloroflexi bacterium]|nr:response regulator transcription factor [Chloroflexota bacterium]
MPAKTRILVVDDEPQTIRYLSMNLKARGYEVLVAADGCEALKLSEEQHLDLVLLDLGIPGPDGFQVLKALRRWTDVPVLVVTARGQERDKVRALDLGADDYLTKPFGAQELLARVRAHLRRAACQGAGPREPFELGDLHIDFAKRQVRVHGQFVHLTPTEYAVMEQLALAGGRVLTHAMLLQRVWGPEYRDEADYLWAYVSRLRRKLEAQPDQPRYILTEPGVGYRLATPDELASQPP